MTNSSSSSPSASCHIATATALPRIRITYCTQCRWMLRAAYFGQELLSTFGTSLGEVALIPATGGIFEVQLVYVPVAVVAAADGPAPEPQTTAVEDDFAKKKENVEGAEYTAEVKTVILWDRKAEGGFPETKVLKQRVRDYIEPGRDLGHSDRKQKVHADDSEVKTKAGDVKLAVRDETCGPEQQTSENVKEEKEEDDRNGQEGCKTCP